MAAVYDEASYNVVGHVTSFTRKEHTCRLGGKLVFYIMYHINVISLVT